MSNGLAEAEAKNISAPVNGLVLIASVTGLAEIWVCEKLVASGQYFTKPSSVVCRHSKTSIATGLE